MTIEQLIPAIAAQVQTWPNSKNPNERKAMTCTNVLRRLNKTYPRTCADCGLGPCQHVDFKGCNIVPLGNKRHDLQSLVDDIKSAVFARTGAISVTEAIGALEIAKMEIFQGQ